MTFKSPSSTLKIRISEEIFSIRQRESFLRMIDDAQESPSEVKAEEEKSFEDELTDNASEEEAEEAEAEEEPEVDPEIQAMKDEIKELEKVLKSKRVILSKVEDKIDDFSKAGYMRKCAEMDNINRKRKEAFVDDKLISQASALQYFLPVLESVGTLELTYENNEFAKKYSAIGWDFRNVFKSMDCVDFSVTVGEPCVRSKMTVVREEYSDDIKKGAVIEQLKEGMELKGNIVKMAEVVVSLGSEADAIKEAEEDAERVSEEKAEVLDDEVDGNEE